LVAAVAQAPVVYPVRNPLPRTVGRL